MRDEFFVGFCTEKAHQEFNKILMQMNTREGGPVVFIRRNVILNGRKGILVRDCGNECYGILLRMVFYRRNTDLFFYHDRWKNKKVTHN